MRTWEMGGPIDTDDRIDDPFDRIVDRMELGRRLVTAREAAGVDRKGLARMVGLSYQYLYQIESGRRSPTVDRSRTIATILGVDPLWLDPRLKTFRPDRPRSSN